MNTTTTYHTNTFIPGTVHIKILEIVLYFELFRHPLKTTELIDLTDSDEFVDKEACLEELLKHDYLQQKEDYIVIDVANDHISQRLNGQKEADKYYSIARKMGRFIGHFPFVRAVCISGSLSKGSMGTNADIDYFIITKTGRLWVCRTLLILFKKIFLLNRRKYFCVNYFIDTQHLDIPEKNIFTAIEINTLIPVFGKAVFNDFIAKNAWSNAWLSRRTKFPIFCKEIEKELLLKTLVEKLLSSRLGENLDRFAMKKTLKRWQKKFANMDASAFELNLKSRTYVSKHHPSGFQSKVLEAFNARVREYQQKSGLTW